MRRLIFKETDFSNISNPPDGFSQIGFSGPNFIIKNEEGTSVIEGPTGPAGDAGLPGPTGPAGATASLSLEIDSTTLISTSQSYTLDKVDVYPESYWGVFNWKDNIYHLTIMKEKFENHDFSDNDLRSLKYFGIFKENGNYLEFVDGFEPFQELNIDVEEYDIDPNNFGYVTSIEKLTEGSGYLATSSKTFGGSGADLLVDITLQYDTLTISFDEVSPPNSNLPFTNLANNTYTFNQTATTGSGTTLDVDISFDESGMISSHVITNSDEAHSQDDVVTLSATILIEEVEQTFTLNSKVNKPLLSTDFSINSAGKDYKTGDIVSVDGGDGLATLQLTANYSAYKLDSFEVTIQRVETGLQFTLNSMTDPINNTYLRFNIDLNDNGEIVDIYEVSSRKNTDGDYDNFLGLNSGFDQFDINYSYGGIDSTWWERLKIYYVRIEEERSNKFPRAEFINLENVEFIHQSSTGTGSSFSYFQTFDNEGNPSTNSEGFIGVDYQINELITLQSEYGSIIAKVTEIDEFGGVTQFDTQDITLESDILQMDFCEYDYLTNNVTILIEDIETWWGLNSTIPWSIEVDGTVYTPDFKGGVLPHPKRPMIVSQFQIPNNFGSNFFNESYLIDPNGVVKVRKFGDNKPSDYSHNPIMTENNIFFINPLMEWM